MKRGWTLLWLLLLAGCSASPRVVRLETGEGALHVLTVLPGASRPLEVDEDEVKAAVARLGAQVKPSARPLEDARRWMGVPAYSGTLYYEVRRRNVVPLDEGSARALALDTALVKAYLGWCERTLRPGDCLRILKDGWRLDDEGRYVWAMAIAYGSVLGETKEAFGEMVDPVAVTATVVGAGTVYMLLWALPEPVSKGVAGVMTVVLVGYLGVDTVWGIIGGWKELVEAVDGATTFEEIRAAGEKYGEVLGERAARLFVMVGTAAVGHTAAQFSSKLPRLPEFEQLALNVKSSLHVRLGALAQVEAVAVSAEGLVISLAPGALAMTAQGMGGGNSTVQPPPAGYRAFKSFEAFKAAMGSAGTNKNWHHIVEQTQTNINQFGPQALQNTQNIIAIDADIHQKISAFYSSKQQITGGMVVRQWLRGQSYEEQRAFGLMILRRYGVSI